MDMSATTGSAASSTASDMEGWKPYLHTSLFSPFSNVPDSGEAFLFPTFRIYSRSTFLAACAFTFCIALVERGLTHVLASLSLHPPAQRRSTRIKTTPRTERGGQSVYISLPSKERGTRKDVARGKGRVLLRGVVFFAATLLRYVLIIVGMGMDWVLLLSVVSGLTVGQLVTDLRTVSKQRATEGSEGRGGEESELLQEEALEEEEEEMDEEKGRDVEARTSATHRRGGSRLPRSVVTP